MKPTDTIFKMNYLVMVPMMATRPEKEIKHYGLPTSGDVGVDKMAFEAWTRVGIPISKMAELWDSGINIRVLDKTTATSIYKTIESYLGRWMEHINGMTLNIGTVPDRDLRLLDAFADSLYTELGLTFEAEHVLRRYTTEEFDPVGIDRGGYIRLDKKNKLQDRSSIVAEILDEVQ